MTVIECRERLEKKERLNKEFPVMQVSRQDLEDLGFDGSSLSDSMMEELTDHIGRQFSPRERFAAIRLEEIAARFGIPRKITEENQP